MQQVSFTEMKAGTREEYLFLQEAERAFTAATADRVLRELRQQEIDSLPGYRISRLTHGLQSATRAEVEGRDIDWIVGALLHDIGDGLAPHNHDRLAAEILRPYVRAEVAWTVEHHGAFQLYYYGHHYGWNRDEREQYRGHPFFDSCAEFCERWDQSSFDPDYPTADLAHFEPMVRQVFARPAYDEAILAPEVVTAW